MATEQSAEATHNEISRELTAGSENGVIKVLKAASCLATNPLVSGTDSSYAAEAAQIALGFTLLIHIARSP